VGSARSSAALATGTFNQDFVELHNRTDNPASVAGLSIQYASASGTTGRSRP